MHITVQWYGPLRDRRGCDAEAVETTVSDLDALWEHLMRTHALPPRRDLALAVAIGDELAVWSAPLAAGDVVAFLPPVAGG